MKTVNVSLVGVGGQGIILTADLLARAAAIAGFDVKKSEIHGMAQRGGSVISQVRFGASVPSPIIPEGGSDVLVAFDKLEALRWAHLLAPGGQVLLNDIYLTPVTVTSGQQPDVAGLEERIAAAFPGAMKIDAPALAAKAGNPRTMNMVLAGALSSLAAFPVKAWKKAMEERLPPKLLEVNEKAFALGAEAAAGSSPGK